MSALTQVRKVPEEPGETPEPPRVQGGFAGKAEAKNHFCRTCGAHVVGAVCDMCNAVNPEPDPFKLHDISPNQDGTLLKIVLRAGAERGPQRLRKPNPLCACTLRLKRLPDGAFRDVAWPGERRKPSMPLPTRLRTAIETMRHGEVAKISLVDKEDPLRPETFEVVLEDWVEEMDCVLERGGAVKVISRRAPLVAWREPKPMDEVTVRGHLRAAAGGARVDYGAVRETEEECAEAIPGEALREGRVAGWRLDEDLATETGAPLCDGVEAILRAMRCREVCDVRIAAKYGFQRDDAPPGLRNVDLVGTLELASLEEDKDEELTRRRGAFGADDAHRRKRVERVEAVKALGNAHFKAERLGRALRRYDRALELAEDDDNPDERLKALSISCRLNRATVRLKLGGCSSCRDDCDSVLKDDPGNLKAKLRKAQASLGLADLKVARELLVPLAKSADKNIAREARKSMVDLKAQLKGQRDAEKKLFSGVYAKPRPDPVAAAINAKREARLREAEKQAEQGYGDFRGDIMRHAEAATINGPLAHVLDPGLPVTFDEKVAAANAEINAEVRRQNDAAAAREMEAMRADYERNQPEF
mmetsp:Transcript_7299/g.21568  ORF Transcript_7299/g.21568 Transcript_7299/m.21568 type:complete len:589 (-) Transcript_7299:21-1787(-)